MHLSRADLAHVLLLLWPKCSHLTGLFFSRTSSSQILLEAFSVVIQNHHRWKVFSSRKQSIYSPVFVSHCQLGSAGWSVLNYSWTFFSQVWASVSLTHGPTVGPPIWPSCISNSFSMLCMSAGHSFHVSKKSFQDGVGFKRKAFVFSSGTAPLWQPCCSCPDLLCRHLFTCPNQQRSTANVTSL